MRVLLLSLLLSLLPPALQAASAAQAEPNCWAANVAEPISAEGLPVTHPRYQSYRGRIQLITVCAAQLERNPRYHPPMREAVAALDFARLAALLN